MTPVHDRAAQTQVLDVLGPTVEFLIEPSLNEVPYCVMRGTIPAGVSVPLHSHPDPESFYVVSGTAQTWVEEHGHANWRAVGPGDFVHIPALGIKL